MGVLACLACLLAGVALATAMYERELRRMASFLRDRDAHGNARMTVDAPGRGLSELASAVNGQLDAMRDERADALRRKREFQRDLASLSHDVRTPLMGAKGYVQLAQGELDAAVRDERLGSAASRLDDMGALLDQLFAYARTSDPDAELDLRPVAVLPVLANVLAGQYPAFEQRGWEPVVLFADEGIEVDSDEDALARLFENLVANALRHGSAAPTIRQEGRRLSFSNKVADPSSIDVDRLFDRFWRADASRSAAGTGLGLAVCANLATAMRATLSATLEGDTLSIHLAWPSD